MKKGKKSPRRDFAGVRYVFFVGILVSATLFHVWQKVEMARVAGLINATQLRAEALGKEQVKLLAAVAIKKTPAFIERVAVEQIGMVRPKSVVGAPLAHWEGE